MGVPGFGLRIDWFKEGVSELSSSRFSQVTRILDQDHMPRVACRPTTSISASAYYEHSSSLVSRALYASLIKQLC